MFDYACIILALLLARESSIEYRAIAYLVLFEFVAHKVFYIVGIQLTDYLQDSLIYLSYILAQMVTLYLMIKIQSHFAITMMIFINIAYNVLTILQYSVVTYDYYSIYPYVVGVIMCLELIYLVWITSYVDNYKKRYGNIDRDYIDHMFCVRRRVDARGVL